MDPNSGGVYSDVQYVSVGEDMVVQAPSNPSAQQPHHIYYVLQDPESDGDPTHTHNVFQQNEMATAKPVLYEQCNQEDALPLGTACEQPLEKNTQATPLGTPQQTPEDTTQIKAESPSSSKPVSAESQKIISNRIPVGGPRMNNTGLAKSGAAVKLTGDKRASASPHHSQMLLQMANSLLSDHKLVDIILQCGDQNLGAHRLVLATYSNLLHTILTDTDGDYCSVLSLDHLGLNGKCLTKLVDFMYTGHLDIDSVSVEDLLEAAQTLSITTAIDELECAKHCVVSKVNIKLEPVELDQGSSVKVPEEQSPPKRKRGRPPKKKKVPTATLR